MDAIWLARSGGRDLFAQGVVLKKRMKTWERINADITPPFQEDQQFIRDCFSHRIFW